jgi:hypothetical protein
MTAAELFESITNCGTSDFGQVLAVLRQREVSWCLIGGLAVNCYVSPVYTAVADFVVATDMMMNNEEEKPHFRKGKSAPLSFVCPLLTEPVPLQAISGSLLLW